MVHDSVRLGGGHCTPMLDRSGRSISFMPPHVTPRHTGAPVSSDIMWMWNVGTPVVLPSEANSTRRPLAVPDDGGSTARGTPRKSPTVIGALPSWMPRTMRTEYGEPPFIEYAPTCMPYEPSATERASAGMSVSVIAVSPSGNRYSPG